MISTDTSTATGVLTGPTQTIALGFYFMANTDLVVTRTRAGVITTLTLDSDYSVTGANNESGGSITVTGQASGDVITIVRTVPYTQLVDLVPLTKLSETLLERALDKLTMLCQQLKRSVDASGLLPTRTASTSLGVDGAGNWIQRSASELFTFLKTYGEFFGTTSGTVAAGDHNHAGVYATAAQGALAYTALQPTGNGSGLTGLTKAQVGLGNADNTPDLEKPISIAAQTALAAKSPLAGSGNIVTVGTVTTGVWQATPINEAYLLGPAANARWQGVPRISSAGTLNVGKTIALFPAADSSSSTTFLSAQSDGSILLHPADTSQLVYLRGNLLPVISNTYYCGVASLPWAGGYTQSAFVITSAREAKTSIRDFTPAELAVAKAIVRTCPRVYQLVTSVAEKGADAARLHSGCIYEEVRQCFVDGGLDPERYSIFCASPRPEMTVRTETREVDKLVNRKWVVTTETVTSLEPVYEELPMVDSEGRALLDANGNPRTHRAPVYETDESGAVLQDRGLRYEELQIWIAAGLREMISDL